MPLSFTRTQGQEDHKEKTVAAGAKAKADRIDDTKEAAGVDDAWADDTKKSSSEDTEVQESEEASGTRTEKLIVREAGLYQSDGSFIPWDDLGIDVETDYPWKSYYEEEKNPCKVFRDNNYEGELVFPDNITEIGDYSFHWCTSLEGIDLPDSLKSIDLNVFAGTPLTNINYAGTMREWENIKKVEEWNTDMFNDSFLETITCSDGVIDF